MPIIFLLLLLTTQCFAGTSSSYSVDSNGNVGIGTTVPDSPLTLTAQSSNQPPILGTTFHITGVDGNPLRLTLDTHSNTGTPGSAVFGRRSRGTANSPSALNAEDTILYLSGYGYGSTGYSTVGHGSLVLSAAQDWTDVNQGTYWRVYTTGLNASTQSERMRIEANGNVGIGSINPSKTLDVTGTVRATAFIGDGSQITGVSASAAPWVETELDFGTIPVWDKTFTVTDASVSGTSKIAVVPSGAVGTSRVGNDMEWDNILVSALPGTGNFTVTAITFPGPIVGKRKINYQVY